MGITLAHLSVSLDGFIGGPDQSEDEPCGVGGTRLQEWHWQAEDPGHEADRTPRDWLLRPLGAYVMGRNMFGPVRGPWSGDWRGWWGPEPPYHGPVFVLTHHQREPIAMEGGTTFHFVTTGFDDALHQAREAAAGADVRIAGGASTVRQALRAGVVEELVLTVVPVLLGAGERIFDDVPDPGFAPVEVIASPHATHIRYHPAGRVR